MADENEVRALAQRFYAVAVASEGTDYMTAWDAAQHAAREALRWRDETRPQQPAAAVPASLTAELAARLDKVLGCHADSMPKEAYFEVDAVMRALQAQQPAALDAARGEAVGSVQAITSLAGETRKVIIGKAEVIDALPVGTAVYAAPPAAVPAGYVPLAAFIEAREQVENWGAYAAPYFQDKWDLAGTLAKMDEQIAAARKGE